MKYTAAFEHLRDRGVPEQLILQILDMLVYYEDDVNGQLIILERQADMDQATAYIFLLRYGYAK